MLAKFVLLLAVGSLTVLALRYLSAAEDEASLERKVAGQLDALREHLFKR